MKTDHTQWVDSFLKNCEALNRSRHTIVNYRCDLNKFIEWYEGTYVGTITMVNAQIISSYIRDNKELSVSTKRRSLSCIKNFFEYLKQTNEGTTELFPYNPVKSKIHQVKLKDRDVEHTPLMTGTHWERIRGVVRSTKERLIVNLMFYGGLRLHELCLLDVGAFNHERHTMTFERKGGDVHTLRILQGELIFSLLGAYMKEHGITHGALFKGSKGTHITTRGMFKVIIKIFKRAGCTGLTPHSFRKACASKLYEKTKDLLYVRDYLNHKDARVTQTYIEMGAL